MTAKTAHTTTPYTLTRLRHTSKINRLYTVRESKRLGTDIMMKTIDDWLILISEIDCLT